MDPTRLAQVPYGLRFGHGVRQEPSMERRRFIALVTGSLLAVPLVGEAQQVGKVARVGIAFFGPTPTPEEVAKAEAVIRCGWR